MLGASSCALSRAFSDEFTNALDTQIRCEIDTENICDAGVVCVENILCQRRNETEQSCQFRANSDLCNCPEYGSCVMPNTASGENAGCHCQSVDDLYQRSITVLSDPAHILEKYPPIRSDPEGDEVVFIDRDLGLYWQGNHLSEELLSYADAAAACAQLVHQDFEDWRLPTLFEFQTILNHATATAPVISPVFENIPFFVDILEEREVRYYLFWTLTPTDPTDPTDPANPTDTNTLLPPRAIELRDGTSGIYERPRGSSRPDGNGGRIVTPIPIDTAFHICVRAD